MYYNLTRSYLSFFTKVIKLDTSHSVTYVNQNLLDLGLVLMVKFSKTVTYKQRYSRKTVILKYNIGLWEKSEILFITSIYLWLNILVQ